MLTTSDGSALPAGTHAYIARPKSEAWVLGVVVDAHHERRLGLACVRARACIHSLMEEWMVGAGIARPTSRAWVHDPVHDLEHAPVPSQ